MPKHGYRYGWDYFKTRRPFIKYEPSEAGLWRGSLYIKDTHQEWSVVDLAKLYYKPAAEKKEETSTE